MNDVGSIFANILICIRGIFVHMIDITFYESLHHFFPLICFDHHELVYNRTNVTQINAKRKILKKISKYIKIINC